MCRLKDGEALFEYGYTFANYQGKGILPSADVQMFEMAKRKGFKRVIGYVRLANCAHVITLTGKRDRALLRPDKDLAKEVVTV